MVSEKELQEYLTIHFANSTATNYMDKYIKSSSVSIKDAEPLSSFADIEPTDTSITFKYLENDSLSNDIQFQRDYLQSYTMYLCLYEIDVSLRLPFVKYYFNIVDNLATTINKKLNMIPFIEIIENRNAIFHTSDDGSDNENENDVSEIDIEFMNQVSTFVNESLNQTIDIDTAFKGFLEDDNNNLFIFIDCKNVKQQTLSQYKPGIMDEILNINQIGNYTIDKLFVNLFKKYEYIQCIKTDNNIKVQFPKVCYLCKQSEDGLVENLFIDPDDKKELLIYPTINYNEYGNIYTFSHIPITIDNVENIRKYACFIEMNDNEEKTSDSFEIDIVSFQENDIQFYGLYDDNLFTEL